LSPYIVSVFFMGSVRAVDTVKCIINHITSSCFTVQMSKYCIKRSNTVSSDCYTGTRTRV